MKKPIRIGMRVSVLDDDLSGVVTALRSGEVCLLTDEGLELWLPTNEVAPQGELPEISNFQAFESQRQKEKGSKPERRIAFAKKGNRGDRILTVDLHLERLPPRYQRADPYEILEYQLDWTRSQVEFARSKGIPRVVVIHGVGEGVLKTEVHALLRRMGLHDVSDAPYAQYGFGATEVRLS